MAQSFEEVTALVPVEPGRFEARLDPNWTIAGKPNGGYLPAVLGRAAVSVGGHPHVLAISGHFLAAPAPESAEVDAEVLRTGRGASQLRVRLRQNDRTCVEALVTTAELDSAEAYWTGGLTVPSVADPESCVR